MNKKFDPANKHKLNNPERLEWISPKKLWKFLNISNPEKIVDIGAGTGFMSMEMMKYASQAIIYALDIEPLMVKEMKATFPDSINFKPMLMEESVIDLPDLSVDIVWSTNVYHELPKPLQLLSEVKRVLKPGGKVLIVDWEKKKESCVRGPEFNHRVDVSSVVEDLEKSGLKNVQSSTDFIFHYAVTGEKQ